MVPPFKSNSGSTGVAVSPVAGGRVDWDEKRSSDRSRRDLVARLIALGGAAPVECVSDNISEGGIHVRIPAGATLQVGQRYEVMLAEMTDSLDQENLAGEGCYATCVRTAQPVEGSTALNVAGLRFDQPLLL